jgi:hypothetical protein
MTRIYITAAICGAGFLSACSPSQINAVATATCYLAQDGATVTAILRPGAAPLANVGAAVTCSASSQVGQAVIAAQ